VEPDRIMTVSFDWPTLGDLPESVKAQERLRRNLFYDEALTRVRLLPGVDRAAVVVGTAFQSSFGVDLRVPGLDSVPKLRGDGPYALAVSDDYFATAGTRLVRGRVFTKADIASAARVTIVNETTARVLWPNRDPIGACLMIDTLPCAAVVGVVEDVHRFNLKEEAAMQCYVPLGEERALGFGGRQMFIRPRGDLATLQATLRAEMLRMNPGLSFVRMQLLQDSIDPKIRPWKLGATMFGVFGALALLVAAIGLYSVISYIVAQRTHELGVRIALGARTREIASLVLRYGLGLAFVGVALGTILALNAGRWIEPLLFDTSPRDPVIFGGVAAVLLAVAVLACALPAWRASRVDPIEALRTE
jgi:predicted permease